MTALLEACLQGQILLCLLCLLKKRFWCLRQMGLGICGHDAHVLNTVSPVLTEVMDQEVPFWYVASSPCVANVAFVDLYLARFTFGLFTTQPEKMSGSSRT